MTASEYFDLYCQQYKDDPRKDSLLVSAEERLNKCYYGKNYNLAVGLLACHDITLIETRPYGETGAIGSKKEGDLSIGYSNSTITADSKPYLSQTIYGIQLLGLRRSRLSMRVTGRTFIC